MTKGEFDTTSTKALICPYCGAEQEDAREQEDWGTPENWTCCDCTRDFIYTTETILEFTSEDLGEYLDNQLDHERFWLLVLQKHLEELEKGKGFDAFLVGEPYTHKFCRFAGKEVAVYACYATASNGARLDVGNMSEAEFTKHFIN